ncbi:cell adhesion molecule CEACAM1-like [Anomaloglossus baeobatrachus]|uniref:cell adhesion molecule CEACAM1-like n=1 Tax=Anomaloglossus baeobatrachus TaxID=238106 RepID=UPI003F50CF8A
MAYPNGSVSAPAAVVDGTIGRSVYLNLDKSPTISEVSWIMEKSQKVIAERNIKYEKEPIYDPWCKGRCELFRNGSLKLREITYEDQGIYTVDVIDLVKFTFWTAEYDLHIYPYLSAPVLKSDNQKFIRGTDVTLQCDAGGQTVTSYTFYRDGQKIICSDRVICRGSFLDFTPISESDSGQYTCTIQNHSSTNTSNPLDVTVSWYPEGNIRCTVQPQNVGVYLICSWPGGQPAAGLTIFIKNKLNQTLFNQKYQNVSMSSITQGTSFTCTGTQLGRNSSCTLIFEPPQCPEHNEHSEIDVIEGETAVLTLNLQPESRSQNLPSVQVLPANFSWFYDVDSIPIKNDQKFLVTANDTFSSLHIFGVTKMESGKYFCRVKNVIGMRDFYFTLNVESRVLNVDVIAGIVIATLVGLTMAGVVVYFILKRKQGKPNALANEKRTSPQSHIYGNTLPGPKQMQYQEESLYGNVLAGRKN